jgi:hypothetical protein
MGKTFGSSRSILLAAVLFAALGSTARAKETPANDCLVGVENADEQQLSGTITCTDGADCDADGATNGSCSFKIRGCINIPGVAGCTLRPIKKVKFKTPHSNNKIVLTPVAGQASSVCGSFIELQAPLKKKGKKPGKRVVNASVKADVKPAGKNSDKDKVTFVCNPCPTSSCVPPTTTTTITSTVTTTSTSTTTVPTCGDGTMNGTEGCDPNAQPTGCQGGETCMPPGAISECTCKTCTPINPLQTLQFQTSTLTTDFCGSAGLVTPPNAPTTGEVTTDTSSTIPLGAGCLYIGGGGSSVPGGITPDGAKSNFDLTQDCGGEVVVAAQAAVESTPEECTAGSGPGKACINDLVNWPNLQSCTTDSDCPHTNGPGNGGVAPSSCVDKPNCLFGPPLPIVNGPLSTCVVNTFGTSASGSLVKTTGAAQVNLPLRSHTFLTGNSTAPCPQCISNLCVGGARAGLACTTTSTQQLTTIDCPPSPDGGAYLPEFQVNLEKLTTGTSSKTNPDGIFCPDQKTFSAFGTQNRGLRPDGDPTHPPIKIVTISQTGSPAGDVTDNLTHATTLAAVFCIPATGNGLIDGAADLAGPAAVSLPGTMQILP